MLAGSGAAASAGVDRLKSNRSGATLGDARGRTDEDFALKRILEIGPDSWKAVDYFLCSLQWFSGVVIEIGTRRHNKTAIHSIYFSSRTLTCVKFPPQRCIFLPEDHEMSLNAYIRRPVHYIESSGGLYKVVDQQVSGNYCKSCSATSCDGRRLSCCRQLAEENRQPPRLQPPHLMILNPIGKH